MKVRYYGHVGQPTGYGDAAGEFCMSMLHAGIELEIYTDARQCPRRFSELVDHIHTDTLEDPDIDAVIVHTLPVSCAQALRRVEHLSPGARRIAYTTWEGCSPISAAVAGSLSQFDEVWVPSDVTGHSVRTGMTGDTPVRVVPHAFDWTAYSPTINYHQGLAPATSTTYRFYYIGAWNYRKNVEGLIRAYLRAFRRDEDVSLHIQSTGASMEAFKIAAISTGLAIDEMPKLTFSADRVSDEAIQALHQDSHCFVTATRGEAWNLPAFDAMLAHRHIIAPSRQGSDQFLKGTSASLYTAGIRPAGGEVRVVPHATGMPAGTGVAQYIGAQGMTVRDDWWDPDPAAIGVAMRHAFCERITSLHVVYNLAKRFGRSAVGTLIRELLEGATQ